RSAAPARSQKPCSVPRAVHPGSERTPYGLPVSTRYRYPAAPPGPGGRRARQLTPRLARDLQAFEIDPVEQGAARRIKLSGKEASRGSDHVVGVLVEYGRVRIPELLPTYVMQRLGATDARVAAQYRNEEGFRWDDRPLVPAV